jgi:CheY-like chemotaxis protein
MEGKELEILQKELAEAKKEIEDLKAEAESAKKANEMKTLFVASMSHEIRTPLNAIEGFSRIIADTENKDDRMKYLQIIESNNNRLMALVDDILDIAKMESGKISINLRTMDINEIGLELKDVFKFRCSENVVMTWDGEEQPRYFVTDRNRLMQVFSNLLGNALRNTYKGSIHFGYNVQEDGTIRCYVRDTGTGIKKDQLSKIFNLYYTEYEGKGGTGIGLSLSKMIVERLGGTIGVNSVYGEGSEFYFILPYMNSKYIGSDDILHTLHPTMEKSKKGPTILVAEDMEDNYNLLEIILKKDYNIIRAHDGIEAVTLNEEQSPDLILMDMKMPNMDGFDATRIIHEVYPETPIVAISAYAYDSDIKKAMDAGCIDFISKPFKALDLLKTINKYLESLS